MLFQVITTILGCLLAVECRDLNKPLRSIPAITGSLVNLGKMDISFHFNAKETPSKMENPARPFHSPIVEDPCSCSDFRSSKNNFINHPSEILNKIISSADLFSFKKEPSSTLCCGSSHEYAQEDIVTFEFGPKDPTPINHLSNLPKLPFLFQNILSRKLPLTPLSNVQSMSPRASMTGKPKAVEIILFPKRNDHLFMPNPIPKKDFKKDNIQIVGDKNLTNDFKSMKLKQSIPFIFPSSVKKDLTAQEKNETKKVVEQDEIEITTTSSPNAL